MAKSVIIRGVTYSDVPSVEIPLSSGQGNAEFFDTSDATLDGGGKMLSGYTAYADGTKYTGTIATKSSSDLTVNGAQVMVPAGYYAMAASKSVPAGGVSAPTTISGNQATLTTSGNGTLTLTQNVSVTPVVDPGYISSGHATNSEVSLSAAVILKGAATYTPGTSDQTISASQYLTGAQTILGDENLVSGNIVAGKSIFGISGSAQIPSITQDSVTKVLSIS